MIVNVNECFFSDDVIGQSIKLKESLIIFEARGST